MLPVKENMICLFGGISCPEDAMKSLTATYLNDFFILNLSRQFFFALRNYSKITLKLTKIIINISILIKYSGEGYWSRPNCGGYVPSARYSFSMACNQSEILGEIVLLGGRTLESLSDKQVYVLSELESSSGEAWGIRD